eukprot:168736_1
MEDTKKDLDLKTKILKRTDKEYRFYEKEKDGIQKKLDDLHMNKDAADYEYNVKKQNEFLEETVTVLTDLRTQLKTRYDDLEEIVTTSPDDLAKSPQISAAKEAMLSSDAILA